MSAAGSSPQVSANRLSAGGKARLIAEILGAYARIRRAQRHEKLEAIVQQLRAAPARAAPIDGWERQRLAWAVTRVLSFLPSDSRCLVRSLVLLALLERRRVGGTLVIGVRTEPDFGAHAWVECEGKALLPTGNGEFARLTVI